MSFMVRPLGLSLHCVTLQGRESSLVSTWINLTHSLVCRCNNCRCRHDLISHYTGIILITIQTLLIILFTMTTFLSRISLCTTSTSEISYFLLGPQSTLLRRCCLLPIQIRTGIHSQFAGRACIFGTCAVLWRAVLRGCCVGLAGTTERLIRWSSSLIKTRGIGMSTTSKNRLKIRVRS